MWNDNFRSIKSSFIVKFAFKKKTKYVNILEAVMIFSNIRVFRSKFDKMKIIFYDDFPMFKSSIPL